MSEAEEARRSEVGENRGDRLGFGWPRRGVSERRERENESESSEALGWRVT